MGVFKINIATTFLEMQLGHFLIIAAFTSYCIALQCPSGLYSVPSNNGLDFCVVCSLNTNNTNSTNCRMCHPSTRTVGQPTGNLGMCSCVAITTNRTCYPFNNIFIPTVTTNGKTAVFEWEDIGLINTPNNTIYGSVTGYKITAFLNKNIVFSRKLPSTNTTYNYTFPSYNVTYSIITELEAEINNNSYYGPPYNLNITIHSPSATTDVSNTISPVAESAIITFGVIIFILLLLSVVFVFLCTVNFPYEKYCKKNERFSLNLEASDPQLHRIILEDGFTSIYDTYDVQMEELHPVSRDINTSYFTSPYLSVNTTDSDT